MCYEQGREKWLHVGVFCDEITRQHREGMESVQGEETLPTEQQADLPGTSQTAGHPDWFQRGNPPRAHSVFLDARIHSNLEKSFLWWMMSEFY